MTQQNIHAVIIGAGLGGLCLAQGLKKRGISFDVYEKDAAADSRTQGYRIRIDETGQRALAACLPPELNLLFRQTCAISGSGGQLLNPQLQRMDGRPSETWRPSAVDPPEEGTPTLATGARTGSRFAKFSSAASKIMCISLRRSTVSTNRRMAQ